MDLTSEKGYGSEEEGNVSYGNKFLHNTKSDFWHEDDSTIHGGDQQANWQRPTHSYKTVIVQQKSKVVPSDQVVEFAFDSAGSDEEIPVEKRVWLKEESVRRAGVKRAQSQQDVKSDHNRFYQPSSGVGTDRADILDRPAHWASSKSSNKKRPLIQPPSSSSSKHRGNDHGSSQPGRKMVQVAHFSAKPLVLAPVTVSRGTASAAALTVVQLKPNWLSQLIDRPQSAPSSHIEEDRLYSHQQQQRQAMEVSDPVEDLPDNGISFPDSLPAEPVATVASFSAPPPTALAATFNRPPEMYHSPLRGKQRQMSVKVGSLRWKLQKAIRECDALQQATLSPDTMSGLTGMHDPRSRASLKLQATVSKCIGDRAHFVSFIVTISKQNSTNDSEDDGGSTTTMEGILVLRKSNAASRLLEGMNVVLFDPQTFPVCDATLGNPRLPILRSLFQEHPLAECLMLCLAWEIAA